MDHNHDSEEDTESMIASRNKSSRLWGLREVVLVVALGLSLLVNAFFVATARNSHPSSADSLLALETTGKKGDGTIFRQERVACSGHGRYYTESSSCECNQCFSGRSCETQMEMESCVVNAGSVHSVMMEEFWFGHDSACAIHLSYRLGYPWNYAPLFSRSYSVQLLDEIKRVHLHARNVDPRVFKTHQIVLANEIFDLLRAASQAYAVIYGADEVVARQPHYYRFRKFIVENPYLPLGLSWGGEPSADDDTRKVEWITYPNNPNGELPRPGSNASHHVYDLAWYWPSYTPVYPMDENVMIFSPGKLTGHTGSRLAWALVRDPRVHQELKARIASFVAVDSQLATVQRMQSVVGSDGALYNFTSSSLEARWARIISLSEQAQRTTARGARLRLHVPAAEEECAYYRRRRAVRLPFVWVECVWEEDKHCADMLRATAGIDTGSVQASEWGAASAKFARIFFAHRQDEFEILLRKLATVFGVPPPA